MTVRNQKIMDTTAIIKDNLAGEAYCGKWDEIISEGAFCRYRKVSSIKGGFLSEKSKGLRWTNNYRVLLLVYLGFLLLSQISQINMPFFHPKLLHPVH